MNILTKICVVVLVVLVLFASVTVIKVASVPQNWRYYYELEKDKAALHAQGARVQKLLTSRQAAEIKDLRGRADQLAIDLANEKKARVPTPEELRTRELAAKLDAQNTRLTELQLNVQAMSERNVTLQDQLDKSRELIARLQDQNRRTTAELTQIRGKFEREQGLVRALQRQLQDRDERILELEKQVVGGVVAGKGAPTAAGKITGAITAVESELASINIGSAQGVTRGLKLYIYRDASFVGYLLVDDVDEGEAAGTVVEKQLDPMVGDKVTNDLLK